MSNVSTSAEPEVLDVRPVLRSGGEPFQAIMAAVQGLASGRGLLLLAPFCPHPLFNVMKNRGFDHEAREIEDGDWEVLFTPSRGDTPVDTSADAERPEIWPEPCLHLDLTDLDPPEPMVRILAAVEDMATGEVLFALLSREPLFLFQELGKRGHQWAGNFDETGTAYRILVRAGA